jgi:hypothetical protein
MKKLMASHGAEVVGLAVMVFQPTPQTPWFDPLPFYCLAKLGGVDYKDASSCDLCNHGVPLETVLI